MKLKEVITKVYLPEWMHKEIKVRCARWDISIKDYLENVVVDAYYRDVKKSKP